MADAFPAPFGIEKTGTFANVSFATSADDSALDA
jgi:hypothetical protein